MNSQNLSSAPRLIASGGPVSQASLAMRTANLRERLEAVSKTGPTDPHVAYKTKLIDAHACAMAVRPVFEEEHPDSHVYKVALAVDNRMWALIRTVLDLPAPVTPAGLAVVGIALAFEVEGRLIGKPWENEDKIAAAARAILSVTGTVMPAAFTGFGDEVAA